jgi:regulator of cell morphogenesis and NO signaling
MPGATAIFRRLKLDFCCGGNVPLAAACEARDLNADAVSAELPQLSSLQRIRRQGRGGYSLRHDQLLAT